MGDWNLQDRNDGQPKNGGWTMHNRKMTDEVAPRGGHGIPDVSLHEVFRATLLAKMAYPGPAWHGMCSAGDHAKLESLVNRCRRLGYCGRDEPTLSELYSEADDRMFNGVVTNPEQFLTEREQTYNLRRRPHGSKTLLQKTQSLNDQDFLIRTMYKHSYYVSFSYADTWEYTITT